MHFRASICIGQYTHFLPLVRALPARAVFPMTKPSRSGMGELLPSDACCFSRALYFTTEKHVGEEQQHTFGSSWIAGRSMLYMISFFFFASYLSLGQANLLSLRQQCWHEYPLSTVNLQSSTAGNNTEHVQLPDRSTSSQIMVPASLEHAFAPWSYPPICTEYLQTVGSKLCVYTNVSFSNGRGISVFTTPELARLLLTLPPLRDAAFPHSNINRFSHNWYTDFLPGKGTGMLAKRPLGFGERVTAYTPALLAFLESELPTLEREKFFRLAVSQLPQATRDMYLDLATAYGIESVKYQDVVKANTFQLDIGGHNHLAVFPETSRLNHDCSPK